jgi:GrpB-like predicted nucleotidyltransferase (UPF0157 family)
MNASVAIVPYDPDWSNVFAGIGTALRTVCGEIARRIDHIGSTAVPGLAAKHRIDVQVAVEDLSSVDRLAPGIEALGYQARPQITRDHVPPGALNDAAEWEKRFFTSGSNARPASIHVRRLGAANQRYALLFRDYLRAHPPSAAAYGELKHRLAAEIPDLFTYTEVKDSACDLIMIAAEDWARWEGWTPGTSDC